MSYSEKDTSNLYLQLICRGQGIETAHLSIFRFLLAFHRSDNSVLLYIDGRTADLFLEINAVPCASFSSNSKQRNDATELRDASQSVELRRSGQFYMRRAKSLATATQAGHDGIRPIAHMAVITVAAKPPWQPQRRALFEGDWRKFHILWSDLA